MFHSLLVTLAASAAQASAADGAALDLLCGYFTERVSSEHVELRMQLDTLPDGTDPLEASRLKLALKRLQAEREVLDRLCSQTGPVTLRQRHQTEALLRKARQANCHADGKRLAMAEAADSPGPELAFYRNRVAACIDSGVAAAEVRFPSSDGGVVFADLYGGGEHGVVLAHGGRFTKESWAEQAQVLADQGYLVLAFDFRRRGRSQGPPGAPPDSEHNDVLGAVRYLRESHGVGIVSVIGASFGGWAAARAGIEGGEIDRLVLLAHSPVEHPEIMPGCKLFIIAEDDIRGDGIQRIDEFREQYQRAPEPKELVVLPGSAHAQYLFETDQAGAVMEEIQRFLEAPCQD